MQTVTCPSCGGTIQHSAELAGQQAACPQCAKPFVMPPLAASIPTALPGPIQVHSSPPQPKTSNTALILGLLLGCATICIVGVVLIGSLGAVSFVRMQRTALINSAKSQVAMLEDAVNMYVLAIGEPPSQSEGLGALISPPADQSTRRKWQGPYLDRPVLPLDPWNSPYHYELRGKDEFRIWSSGPDGQSGTADDISTTL